MKKLVLLTGVILIACVLIGSVPPPEAPPAEAVTVQTTAPEEYVITDSDGRIAVFRKGEAKPLRITDVYTDSLPRSDAKKLREGIPAKDKKELERILEDLCS